MSEPEPKSLSTEERQLFRREQYPEVVALAGRFGSLALASYSLELADEDVLSIRERKAMNLMSLGYSPGETATAMDLVYGTATSYRYSAKEGVRAYSPANAVVNTFQLGLLDEYPGGKPVINRELDDGERHILKLMSEGFTISDIASSLETNYNRAANMISAVMRAYNVKDNLHAVRIGLEIGDIPAYQPAGTPEYYRRLAELTGAIGLQLLSKIDVEGLGDAEGYIAASHTRARLANLEANLQRTPLKPAKKPEVFWSHEGWDEPEYRKGMYSDWIASTFIAFKDRPITTKNLSKAIFAGAYQKATSGSLRSKATNLSRSPSVINKLSSQGYELFRTTFRPNQETIIVCAAKDSRITTESLKSVSGPSEDELKELAVKLRKDERLLQGDLAEAKQLQKEAISQSPEYEYLMTLDLTLREMKTLQLLAEGLTNASIAEQMKVSVGTIKTYTGNIFRKLAVDNRTHAAAFVVRGRLGDSLSAAVGAITTPQGSRKPKTGKQDKEKPAAQSKKSKVTNSTEGLILASENTKARFEARKKLRGPSYPGWERDMHEQINGLLAHIAQARRHSGLPWYYSKEEGVKFAVTNPDALNPLVLAGLLEPEQLKEGSVDLKATIIARVYSKSDSPLRDLDRKPAALHLIDGIVEAYKLLYIDPASIKY